MRLDSPAFERNREPILGVLRSVLSGRSPRSVEVLEIGSGPGRHACWFSERLEPVASWVPSDPDPRARASVRGWAESEEVTAIVGEAMDIALGREWPRLEVDLVVAINVLHMVDSTLALDLLARASSVVRPGGHVVVYDCFTFDGEHVSDSNEAFAARLRLRYGGDVHAFEPFDDVAARVGFEPGVVHWLPANNQGVVWTRRAASRGG